MDTPRFGVGKGPEAPSLPVEGRPAPEIPPGAEPPRPREEGRETEDIPEMVIEAPPQEGETLHKKEKPVKTVPAPARSLKISEHDLSGDIDIGRAAELQDEMNA